MADDTQDPTPPRPETTDTTNQFNPQGPSAERKKPKYEATSQVGKLWDAFGNPEDSANTLAGVNSRHNDTKDMTVPEVLKSMSFHNVKSFYRAPCARDSLLTGMGFGFAAGGLRTIVGGIYTACDSGFLSANS